MLEFAIVSKKDEFSLLHADKIRAILNRYNCSENIEHPEIVITVGGDGTMLRAVHQYLHLSESVRFIGVHTGTLGFYTNFLTNEIEEMCQKIVSTAPSYNEFSLLEIKIKGGKTWYALNEFRIENVYHTQTIKMYMNDQYLQTFKGNGVCISTSIGSTGYNRSLGGPIVELSLPLIVMTEIAGIHHRANRSLGSSLVMGKQTRFKMILTNNSKSIIGIDHFTLDTSQDMEITCCLSNKTIKLAQFDDLPYPKRLHRAFLK